MLCCFSLCVCVVVAFSLLVECVVVWQSCKFCVCMVSGVCCVLVCLMVSVSVEQFTICGCTVKKESVGFASKVHAV